MALEGISRHPDLWYDDGTVILIAENTGFRVYRGPLTKHSEVFRDMFSFPQPTAVAGEVYEGCPIVRLAGDTADEIAEVMKILYDGYISFSKPDEKIPFATIAAALCVGTKYEFTMLRQEALRRITACYPPKLTILQQHLPSSNCRRPIPQKNRAVCSVIWNDLDPIAVFHLSRRFNLVEVLPGALYKCASELSVSSLFAALNATNKHPYILSAEELEECLETRDHLAKQNRNIYRLFLDNGSSNGCLSVDCCTAAMKEMVLEYYHRAQATDCDALGRLSRWVSSFTQSPKKPPPPGSSPNRLCHVCSAAKSVEIEEQQEKIWRFLQSKFKVPTENGPTEGGGNSNT